MIAAKRFFSIFAISLLFLGLLGICLFLFLLPAWLEHSLVPDLAQNMGIERFSWNVRGVGLTGADFGDVRIGDEDVDTIGVGSARLDYTISGILKKRIERVRMDGVRVQFRIQDGKPVLPGLEALMQDHAGGDKIDEKGRPKPTSLPVRIGSIEIANAVLEGRWEDNQVRLPLEITVSDLSGKMEELKADVRAYPWGERISLEVRADLTERSAHLKCLTHKFNLAVVPPWVTGASVSVAGKMDLAASARVSAAPFTITDIDLKAGLTKFIARAGNFRIQSPGEQDRAADLTLSGQNPEQLKLGVSGLAITAPVLLELANLEGQVQIKPNLIKTSMDFNTLLNFPTLNITPDIEHSWRLSASLADSSAWEFNLDSGLQQKKNESDETVRFRIRTGKADIRSAISRILAEGSGDTRSGNAEISVRVLKTHLEARSVTADFPELLFKAALASDFSDKEKTDKKEDIPMTFSFVLPDVSARVVSERFDARQISVDGEMANPFSLEPKITGQVRMTGAKVSDTLFSVGADDIQMTFPFAWPPKNSTAPGSFSIRNIAHRKQDIAAVRGTFRQEDMGVALKAKIENRLIPGLNANLNGAFSITSAGLEGRIGYEIPRFHTGESMDLGRFFPKAAGVSLNGSLEASGEIMVPPGEKPSASLKVSVENTSVKAANSGLVVEGIDLDIQSTDLPELRSLPHQKLGFDSLRMGNVSIENGTVVFQIEAADRVFIEKSHFNWCGGNVDTNAALVGLPELNVDLILYCDRLGLSQVLQQLGGVKGEGEGAVNGRIPISYRNGQFTFQDGFLYSTPGRGGVIKLTGTESLLSGVPEGTTQFTQIDLAREALKHYDYNWARVNVTTSGGNLQLGLQLDGKPVDPLPFKYDTTLGGFARVEAESPGSRFQGIRLDVNFNLPLDKVIKYGKGLKDLF